MSHSVRTVLLVSFLLMPGWALFLHAQSTPAENVTLCLVLDQLKQKTTIRFGYDRELFSRIIVPPHLLSLSTDELLAIVAEEYQIAVNVLSAQHILLRRKDDPTQIPVETVYRIMGQVSDGQTGEPLVGASVYTSDLRAGVTTDVQGFYELEVGLPQPEPLYLLARYLGYQAQSRVIPSHETVVKLNFRLNTAVLSIPAITVKSQLPQIRTLQPGVFTATTNKPLILNSPLANDPLRQLQLLPGVAAFDDLSGQPKVRGASVEGNQFLLNGMTLLNVDHFFGIYSAINPYVIDQISLHKTYFPLQNSGRSSAVIALSSTLHSQPLEATVEISPLTANAAVRGSYASKIHFIAGARSSLTNLGKNSLYTQLYQAPVLANILGRTDNVEIRPEFTFNDAYAQVVYTGKRDSFFGQFYTSYDHSAYSYTNNFIQRFARDSIQVREQFMETSRWNNTAWSSGYQLKANPSWSTGWFLGQSKYTKEDGSELQNISSHPRAGSPKVVQVIENDFNNHVQTTQLRWYNQWRPSTAYNLEGGLEVEHLSLSNILQTNLAEQIINVNDKTWNYSGWMGFNYQQKSWEINAGLRTIYDQLTAQVKSSPRLKMNYHSLKAWNFYALAGIYPQWMRTSLHENPFNQTYQFWVLANNKNIPVLTSSKTALGSIYKYRYWEIQTELFYDHYDGLLQHVLATPGVKIPGENVLPRYRLFTGQGHTYGADVWLKTEWKNYLGWLSYTWSKASQRYAQLNQGRDFPAEDDRRHQLKWINTLSFGRFYFNWSLIYASGKPYLDYRMLRISSIERNRIDLNRSTRYLEPYRRVDVGLSYKQPWRKSQFTASVSIYNFFDQTNVKYNQFIYGVTDSGFKDNFSESYVAGQTITLLPFTPSVSLKWQF